MKSSSNYARLGILVGVGAVITAFSTIVFFQEDQYASQEVPLSEFSEAHQETARAWIFENPCRQILSVVILNEKGGYTVSRVGYIESPSKDCTFPANPLTRKIVIGKKDVRTSMIIDGRESDIIIRL
jgi:hypothetical protein